MKPLDVFLCFAAFAGGIVLVACALLVSYLLWLFVKGLVAK